MKSIFLILTFFLSLCAVFSQEMNQSQSIYYASFQLKKYSEIKLNAFTKMKEIELTLDTNSYKQVATLLYPVLKDSIQTKINNKIKNSDLVALIEKQFENSKNPFIKISASAQSNDYEGNSDLNILSQSLTSLGGLDVTTYADALAKFLVKRTKEELSIAFFEKFKDDLKNYDELQVLFPNTYRLLMAIDDEIYNFSGYLNTLRATFEKDLSTLIPNLRQAIEVGFLGQYLNTNPLIKDILTDALLVGEELQSGTHPGDVLRIFSEENHSGNHIRNFTPALKTLNLFSQSIRSKQQNRYWINTDSLNLLLNDEKATMIFLGLIYEQSAGIEFIDKNDNTISFQKILRDVKTKYDNNITPLKKYIKEMQSNAQRVDASLRQIREKDKLAEKDSTRSKSDYRDHYAFYVSAIDMMEKVTDITEIPAFDSIPVNDTLINRFFETANIAGEVYLGINEKKYFSTVVNVVVLLDNILPSEYDNKEMKKNIDDINKIVDKEENGKALHEKLKVELDSFKTRFPDYKYGTTFKEIMFYNEELDKAQADSIASIKIKLKEKLDYLLTLNEKIHVEHNALTKIIKYGNLGASIVEAENSDEVAEIIEAIALPAGSSRIKRESAQNLSINAYVGLYGGLEWLPERAFVTGLSAPVGFAYSFGAWGKKKEDKGGKSITIFMPLIDIGALVSFRFDDNDTELASNVQLKNIFAPGMYAYLGFGKIPISLGIGGQYGPRLYNVSADNTENYRDYYLRAAITLAVDIPVLNLYTKPK